MQEPDHNDAPLSPRPSAADLADARAAIVAFFQDLSTARSWTTVQVAAILRATPRTVERYIKAGRLHAIRVHGGDYRITRNALIYFIACCTSENEEALSSEDDN